MKYAKVVDGDVCFKKSDDYSEVVEIKGSLDCRGADTKAAFPKLTTCGGYIYCSGADTKAAFPKLTTCGGYIYCSGADTKAAFPKLTTQNCGDSKAMKRVAYAFRRSGFVRFDGILSFILTTKLLKIGIKIHRIVVVGEAKASFCIETRDGTLSHGDTIKQAKDSLIYKIGERDKSAYEKWTLDTVVTKRQAIESYRVITGACEAGTRHFVESVGKTKEKYTVREIVALTDGQYGHDSYKTFFTK
jgi:hypothetical protein